MDRASPRQSLNSTSAFIGVLEYMVGILAGDAKWHVRMVGLRCAIAAEIARIVEFGVVHATALFRMLSLSSSLEQSGMACEEFALSLGPPIRAVDCSKLANVLLSSSSTGMVNVPTFGRE